MRPAVVEADDAGRDPGQHRLGEAAALVELAVGLDQLALLALELVGHAVEGAAQATPSSSSRLAFRHARRQIAGADPLGGARPGG